MLLTKCSYPLPFLVRIPSNKKNRYPFGYLFYLWRRGRDFFRASLGEMSERSTGAFLCRSFPSLPFLVRIPSNKKTDTLSDICFIYGGEEGIFFALRLEKCRNAPPEPSSVARFPRSHFWFESLQIKKQIPFRISVFLWRRGRDSNPRMGISHYTISNRAPSTNSATSPRCFQLLILPQKNSFVNRFWRIFLYFSFKTLDKGF